MSFSFPYQLKEYIYKEFQKEIDKETELKDELETVDDLFYFFHKTDMEERFNNLLIEADIRAINALLFQFLDIFKFFKTQKYHPTSNVKAAKELKNYIKEQQMLREKIYNN